MCGGAGRGLGHICRFQGLVPEDKPTQGGLALMLEKVGKDPGRYGETPFVNQRVYFKRHFIDKTQLAPSCVGFCQGGREGRNRRWQGWIITLHTNDLPSEQGKLKQAGQRE